MFAAKFPPGEHVIENGPAQYVAAVDGLADVPALPAVRIAADVDADYPQRRSEAHKFGQSCGPYIASLDEKSGTRGRCFGLVLLVV